MTTDPDDDFDDDDDDPGVWVGWVVGKITAGDVYTKPEVEPRDVLFTLAVTFAPKDTDATFKDRVKLPEESAIANWLVKVAYRALAAAAELFCDSGSVILVLADTDWAVLGLLSSSK